MSSLEGKIALITGGGSGLGYAIAHALGHKKVQVILGDARAESLREATHALSAEGIEAIGMGMDVSQKDSVDATLQKLFERHGRLDILINNAGTDVTKPILELDEEEWERVLHVNLFGPFYASKKALVIMKDQGNGEIINITSTAAKRAWPNASAYHASKWGLLGFSHALHVEARAYNVRVCAVVAGGMRTPFIMDRFPDTDPHVLQDPAVVAETIVSILSLPRESVVPEIMVTPLKETSWP